MELTNTRSVFKHCMVGVMSSIRYRFLD